MAMSGSSTFAILVLVLLVVVLAALLVRQVRQRRQLRRWLDAPQGELPDGSGAWREIFSRLQRLRKEEHKAHLLLKSRLDHFHQAVRALPDGVILLDGDGHIQWLNPAACGHFGLDATRDIGILAEQLIRGIGFQTLLADFRAGRDVLPLALPINEGMTGKRILSVSLIAFADTGTLLLSHDIGEIVRAENIRRDFIANVSHELRTPLTVISGFLEQLTADSPPPPESTRRFLSLMSDQALRMNRLVGDLLTLSRLENAADPPREDRVDVPALMDSLLAEAQALSGGRHTIEPGVIAPIRLRGSADEIRSAFGNLVSNAVRYTPAGGRIVIAWQEDGEELLFTVTDNGIGIPPEHIPRLTERFYRIDKGRSTATGGTGLGLAIVKHVLARHQGQLRIESKIGTGSTFCACLPCERRIAGRDRLEADEVREHQHDRGVPTR